MKEKNVSLLNSKSNVGRNSQGITLIALVVTIVVLLILAGITVTVTLQDGGVIAKAQEVSFKTEVRQYQEQLEMEKISQFLYKKRDIVQLKEELEKQIASLQKGKENIQKGEEAVIMIEEKLDEMYAILLRMHDLFVILQNATQPVENIDAIKEEISRLIIELNRISDETEYEGKLLFDTNNPYTIRLDNGYFDQGKLVLRIENLKWENIYGSETIDYNNLEEAMKKAGKAIDKINIEIVKLGIKQNVVEMMKEYTTNLEQNIQSIYDEIFGDGTNFTKEEATKKAESWGTTIRLIEITKNTYFNINKMLQRIKEIVTNMPSNTGVEGRQTVQIEIEQNLKEIQRQLLYTGISDKKLFAGTFPYIEETNLKELQLIELSVYTNEDIEKTIEKITASMQTISNKITELTNKQDELVGKQAEQAEKDCAFEIVEATSQIELPKKYKDKLKIENGELIYIGTDAQEQQWAIEIGIQVIK